MKKQPELVLVEWVDSGHLIPGWQWLNKLGPQKAQKRVSAGFLVQDDENTKVIAPNLGASGGENDWDQASGLLAIPAAAVLKVVRLTSLTASASVPSSTPTPDQNAA